MRIAMYYATEVRYIDAEPGVVSIVYENGNHINKLYRRKSFDIKNIFVSTKGKILGALQPVNDSIGTLNKIEIYEGDVLIDTITGITNPVYKFGTPNPKTINVDLQVPQLEESFQVDL